MRTTLRRVNRVASALLLSRVPVAGPGDGYSGLRGSAFSRKAFSLGLTVEIAPVARMSDAPPFEGDNRPVRRVSNHDKAPACRRSGSAQRLIPAAEPGQHPQFQIR